MRGQRPPPPTQSKKPGLGEEGAARLLCSWGEGLWYWGLCWRHEPPLATAGGLKKGTVCLPGTAWVSYSSEVNICGIRG